MAIEGKVPNIPENEGEDDEQVNYEKAGEGETGLTHQLSLEQQVYYNTVLEALNSGKRMDAVLDSLNTDSSLTRLIPYISRSAFNMIMDCSQLAVLDRGVKILEALSLNKHRTCTKSCQPCFQALCEPTWWKTATGRSGKAPR
jgi:hypothetical protein